MCNGKILTENDGNKVIDCCCCKFAHIMPIPTERESERFYKEEYYQISRKARSVSEIKKQVEDREKQKGDLSWIRKTLFTDIDFFLKENLDSRLSRTFLDVGCSKGELLKFMSEKGWDSQGIEPSLKNFENGLSEDIKIYKGSFNGFVKENPDRKFSFISLLNVLEHVPNPSELLEQANYLLEDGGIILIKVPNDFSVVQSFAKDKIKKKDWWVAVPDHINYFTAESLGNLLINSNFDVLRSTVDFPMEVFLLMGDNYIDTPSLGSAIHNKRVSFELSMPNHFRRTFNDKMAELEIGRNLVLFAKKNYREIIYSSECCYLSRLMSQDFKEWSDALVTIVKDDKSDLFSILDKSKELIGYGGLMNMDKFNSRAEISFLMKPISKEGSKEYRSIFSSFLSMITDYAFENMGLNKLSIETDEFRIEQITILEENGFEKEGLLRGNIFKKGSFYNSIIHSVFKVK